MKRLILLLLIGGAANAQELTLSDAIARALAQNPELIVERESLNIANANVERAEAAYEPSLRAEGRLRERTDPVNSVLSGAPHGEIAPAVRTFQSSASVVQLLPTGATVSVFSGLQRDETNSVLALLTPSWSTILGAEVRQPLLQNRRIDPARRAIRIARVDRTRALSSLRRMASETTAAVERTYWTLVAARQDAGIREASVQTAEKQRDDTRVRIEAGTQAEAELASATAEVERRRGELAVARENAARAENALRNLMNEWERAIVISTPETLARPNTDNAIELALRNRPELEELQQRLTRQDVEIDAALDRVRPQVDLVANYSGRGLAGTRNETAIPPFGPVVPADDIRGGLGQSLRTIGENEFPDASLGVAVVIPIGNTAAKKDVAIARAVRRQGEAQLEGARQRITMEVRNALATVESVRQRVEAARATREAAEVQLQGERDRYEAGTTNLFFIITRQNELAAAQLTEVIALADARRAETELARATGMLLEQRAIVIGDSQ